MDNFESHQDMPGFLTGAPVKTRNKKLPHLRIDMSVGDMGRKWKRQESLD